ncbi:hypothetical protein BCR37DRAFT_384796 [Protomyces lactucae-debilis]|uniref:Hyaluronan/mRNA-binding protein domain-containing protein n=1 Tax=Protomyces lactucae-debilis TaxID=2754530 RepID=A0A1Y2EPF9_PROLT|nr:uncharacterized protein BCR37DRAFT_384796 [Protomyces lactucae-debilis]ORY73473.1 hypothetical protein BCR37DRAFT_384796 [Protomyces lactucae-debilis]
MTRSIREAADLPKHSDGKGHILDPHVTQKKQGSGSGNWGRPEDDITDLQEFSMLKTRRRSNSQSQNSEREKMATKFEKEDFEDEVFH